MLSQKPEVVVYLSSHFIDVYINGEEGSNKWVFPQELIENLKIKNKEEFFNALAAFLTPLDLPRDGVLIVLSQDGVYQKGTPLQQTDTYPEFEEFLNTLPLSESELVQKEVTLGRSRVMVATNKWLFIPVVKILTQMGLKVLGVVPAGLFLDTEVDVLMAPEILTILSQKHLLHSSNFLDSHLEKIYRPSTSSGILGSGFLTWILLLIIALLAGGLWYIITQVNF